MTGERYSLTVCPWSAAHPRHDHQQIFPLQDGRLLLAWSEYYVRQPSLIGRTPYSREGRQSDLMPCRLSGKISSDRGRSWSATFTLQNNFANYNVKHPNLLRLPSGEVLCFFSAWWSETDRRVYVKRSSDDCETWSAPLQISQPPGFHCINHDHVIRLRGGRIILPCYVSPIIWRPESHFLAFAYYSDDDGRTWRRSEDTMDLPALGAEEPSMVERADGSIYCVLRSSVAKLFKAVSRDGGVTWSEPEPTGLARAARLSDGVVLCVAGYTLSALRRGQSTTRCCKLCARYRPR